MTASAGPRTVIGLAAVPERVATMVPVYEPTAREVPVYAPAARVMVWPGVATSSAACSSSALRTVTLPASSG